MALVIAGERSGVGKTTVTLALLSSLSRRAKRVQSFKVGPDYIDPMFHQWVTGHPCRNLDPVLTSETYVQECFTRHIQGVDYALVEGVMGLFDGASGRDDFASTAHMARLLQLPVLLVVDCSSLSRSVAAIAHGYRSFDPRITIAGVVLNRVGSDRHWELLQDALAPLELPILGVLRRNEAIAIPDRHLGLVPTAELTHLDRLIDRLAHIGDSCFDWERLFPLLSPPLVKQPHLTPGSPLPTRIAIARDRAFSFYYQDNLDIWQQLGAELVPWSPLTDAGLPEGVQGLYFGGGFPEVFAEPLAENTEARAALHRAIVGGMPTYAECGGLMYLCQNITDFEGQSWPMVGILPTTAVMDRHLTLGYRQATAGQDSLLLSAGAKVWGHEFHRSQLTAMPKQPLWEIKGYHPKGESKTVSEGWQLYQLHASYIHLHWGGHPELAAKFLQRCHDQAPNKQLTTNNK
ncbi:MAG TPA: cobyrinic acid a,c-diamide synthase [Cyanobacteria bacterium UBA8803]|nr:cobyrinic acid a,c-diamide synthase [Cyanobacteria bacterium UBA9273]HBL58052.1 cobyrinic acid a,c-diamide synthase [Cyanobacteria bacterium UBA8803]